ncbi:unnamed protein product [Eruca vesicaria subsp. sativa]|uniref:TIR domain-containing protein n=1 Tax=Eruca vesicaria subsp. sativa TaxID=29727 RepID=A0ABC8IXS5_ERUVS|nr:unnamed protein product [Eruca vesicaria subsp. sativa]
MVDPARARQPQVFVNSGATELPDDFIKHLMSGLTDLGILNVFMDRDEWWGRDLDRIFTCIEESTVALAIFSPCYPETEWCLDELVKMKERANKKKLLVIPIFFNVSKNDVRNFEGEFGDRFMELRKRYAKFKYDPFRVQRWETSVMTISRMEPSLTWETQSSSIPLAMDIIREVKKELDIASNPGFSLPLEFHNHSHLELTNGEVFVSALLVAFLLRLFIARLVFTDMTIFGTAKWLVGFPVTIVVLYQLHCALTQQNRRAHDA